MSASAAFQPQHSSGLDSFAEEMMPPPVDGGESGGLTILLEEGNEQPSTPVAEVPTIGAPLTQAEIRQILDRLPTLDPAQDDVQAFRLPESSLPPPRTGATIEETFPPDMTGEGIDEVSTGPLQVLNRWCHWRPLNSYPMPMCRSSLHPRYQAHGNGSVPRL
jgi:hypothetical protein